MSAEINSSPIPSSPFFSNVPDFLALSTDRKYYFHMSQKDVSLCRGNHIINCPTKYAQHSVNDPSCALALFDKNNIKTLCKFRFMENSIIPAVQELNEGSLLLTDIKEVIINCNGKVQKKAGCKFCVIKLPCFCSLLADTFRVSERIQNCQENSEISYYNGNNLAVLQYFFNDSLVKSAMADHEFSTKIRFNIPSLKLDNKLDEFIGEDRKINMDLTLLTKKNEK